MRNFKTGLPVYLQCSICRGGGGGGCTVQWCLTCLPCLYSCTAGGHISDNFIFRTKGVNRILPREYWMIYRGPGFLAVAWFGSSSTPSPVSNLSLFLILPVCRRSSINCREGGEARSQIIRRQESLALYKSFNTPWNYPTAYRLTPPFSIQAACRRMRRLEAFLNLAASNFKLFSKIQNQNLKI